VVGDDLGVITLAEAIVIGDADSNAKFILGEDNNNYGILEWVTSRKSLEFHSREGGTFYPNTLVIKSGNVGIGTMLPSYKLQVDNGDISLTNQRGLRSNRAAGDANGELIGTSGTDMVRVGESTIWGAVTFGPGGLERMRVTSNGNVGIGTTIPEQSLHIYDNSDSSTTGIRLENGATGGRMYTLYSTDNTNTGSGQFQIRDNTSDDIRFVINPFGNVGIGTADPAGYKLYVAGAAYSTGGWSGSDARWKKDITPLENSLNNVLKLQGVHYYWKTDEYPDKGFTKEKQIGLIAQDVEKVIPELVNTSEDGYKSVSYEKLTAVLVEAVKELKAENNKLKSEKDAEIRTLKAEVNELRTLINKVIEPPAMPASHKQSCAGVYDNDGI